MSSSLDQFLEAVSINSDLEVIIDPDALPAFDTTALSREEVAAMLAPLVGQAVRVSAELYGSAPRISPDRWRHIAKAEASLERADEEHASSFSATLRPSPRGAALAQVASNELTASSQLGGAVTSMITELGDAYKALDERTSILDETAPLIPTDEDRATWRSLSRNAINAILSPDEKLDQ